MAIRGCATLPVSPPVFAIALLSGAALGYEILLTRLFAIIQWHHFAYMMISAALLGYGAAGTVVTLMQRWLQARFTRVFSAAAILFGLGAVAGFLSAQRVPFNPLAFAWDPREIVYLVMIYLLLREFCRARSFDVGYYPGMEASEANRYNLLDQAYYFEAATALLGNKRDEFMERYKLTIAPATDDRPYFFHFFKWRTLPEILRLKERGGLPLLEWGYPVLIITLLQAIVVSLLLVLLPLWLARKLFRDAAAPPGFTLRTAVYFTAIGLAFMFIEIAFIQRFILFLSHPLYAVAVVLCAFLLFAGLGSRFSARIKERRSVVLVVGSISAIAVLYLILLPALFQHLFNVQDIYKIAVSIALIAPLAFPMGMLFPLGLARLANTAHTLLPWAWGINACASVVAAILATALAIHLGFTAVVIAALLLYGFAAMAFGSSFCR